MKVRPIFAWYDCWIGIYWDRQKHMLYLLPIPCVGFVIEFPWSPTSVTCRCGRPKCSEWGRPHMVCFRLGEPDPCCELDGYCCRQRVEDTK